jgi:transposase, IS6 family
MREADIILLCVRWYVRYSLSYRDLGEIMRERGLQVDHTTIYRWVQQFVSEPEKRCRSRLKATNDSWRLDETYVKVKGKWTYLYRAVDLAGNTLEFFLSATRDAAEGTVPEACEQRPVKYLNNSVEQDHRFIKRLVKPGQGFFSVETAGRTLQGYEVMHLIGKGQIRGVDKGDISGQIAFIASLFGVAA